MYDSPFTPLGPTYSVGLLPVQILASNNNIYSSVRIVNLAASVTRVGWITQSINPGNINVAAAASSTPTPNCITMGANAVETFCLPINSWMQASQNSVEVTPGEGI